MSILGITQFKLISDYFSPLLWIVLMFTFDKYKYFICYVLNNVLINNITVVKCFKKLIVDNGAINLC